MSEPLLIGREVVVSVGEPWDFESSDGRGILHGRIIEVYTEGRGEEEGSQRVRLEVTPFVGSGGNTVNKLVATARHLDEPPGGIAERLARGEVATANFSYAEEVPEGERDLKMPPYLIGSLDLKEG